MPSTRAELFLLGRWTEAAKEFGTNEAERTLLEFNARNQVAPSSGCRRLMERPLCARRVQITLWGPHGEITEYASKPFSGLVSDYYARRWTMFMEALRQKGGFDAGSFNSRVREFEQRWQRERKTFPVRAKGDPWQIATRILMPHHA